LGNTEVCTPMKVSFGAYQLDTETRTLLRSGERIPIEAKAFDLLAYLIEHRERVISADELLDALWSGVRVTPAALSRTVGKTRRSVGDDGEHQAVIHTEHGHGFRFVAEVSVLSGVEGAAHSPTGSRARWFTTAGVVALLLAVTAAWLVIRPLTESAPTRSVAVLPFANMSQDATAEPFANGIYDDILTQIAKIRDLRVIARTSMERLDPNLSLQEIGNKLGVATILEGGVQRIGNRIRINVQLIDCESKTHLWAETYDRELTTANVFAIQSEIAASVADALKLTLSPEEHLRLEKTPTQDMAAYQAYLLGKQRLKKETSASLVEAVDLFQQATDLDPNFALAYVGLADGRRDRSRYGRPTRQPAGDGEARGASADFPESSESSLSRDSCV
jgi:TolB-like protein/DNA-binding winged helix-turn-helix (wHTH) protein